ncbi:MAG TPA: hypothetical protein VF520_03590 [Thermoleophilaceae bacterium]
MNERASANGWPCRSSPAANWSPVFPSTPVKNLPNARDSGSEFAE